MEFTFDLEKLNWIRVKKGMTYSEIAKATGISNNTIGRTFKGTQIPDPARLGRIAMALGVEPQEFMKLKTEKVS